jgi:phage tail-like protein
MGGPPVYPTVRAPLGALYTDNLRYDDPADTLLLINTIPEDGETGVHDEQVVQLQLVTTVVGDTIAALTQVWVSIDGATEVLAYDDTLGGFQPGFGGTAIAAASPGAGLNDEFWISLAGATWPSEAVITIRVAAAAVMGATYAGSYSFTIEDTAPAEISELLWLTPTYCRIKWDGPVQSDDHPGSSLYLSHIDEGLQIQAPDTLLLSGQLPDTDWVGYVLQLTGSCYAKNNRPRLVLAADPATGAVTLDTTVEGELTDDTGTDIGPTGAIVSHRRLRATVSPYVFEARLSSEGLSSTEAEDRVQVTHRPLILSCRLPYADELAPGEDPTQYTVLRLLDGISFGRLYTIRARGVLDLNENPAGSAGTSLDFTSPLFGLKASRLQLWKDMIPPTDKQDDIELGTGELCKLCRCIQDLLDQAHYWVNQLELLRDPDLCPESLLDDFLYWLGLPFRFEASTEMQKRKLCTALLSVYARTGVKPGIENMLLLYIGTPFSIRPYISMDCWILGTSLLGFDTVLGPAGPYLNNCYEVLKLDPYRTLTDDERRAVWDIAQWADPADMHIVALLEDLDTNMQPDWWVLGYSRMGMNTYLR